MWLLLALASAFFAGLVAILAKVGIQHTPSNLATALRTLVVLGMAWGVVFIIGSQSSLTTISGKSLAFLILSGLTTGASWLCFFKALQAGDVTRVAVVDRSSIVLTVLLGMVLFGEVTHLWTQLLGVAAFTIGTWVMIQKQAQSVDGPGDYKWLAYAAGGAIFAAATTLLIKVGISDVDSSLGTAIRTVVVLVMAWIVVLVSGEHRQLTTIPRRDLLFLALSGLATGASWLCFYRGLQIGPLSAVVPIDKLSIVVTVIFAALVFGERLTRRGLIGLVLVIAGTILLAL
ncbi:MAG: EamA family transporter [Actinobacteria bacterium]|nr:EamA family transporter [Actinomycetota bacterium]